MTYVVGRSTSNDRTSSDSTPTGVGGLRVGVRDLREDQ